MTNPTTPASASVQSEQAHPNAFMADALREAASASNLTIVQAALMRNAASVLLRSAEQTWGPAALTQPAASQDAYGIAYEYDGPFGLHRSFDGKKYNGRYPDRSVTLYTHPQQPSATGWDGWRQQAAAWLRERARKQDETNKQCPDHVKCYPSWEKRVRDLNWLAADLEREDASQPTSGAAGDGGYLHGFDRSDLAALADGLDCYDIAIDGQKSTTAAAAEFIRAALATPPAQQADKAAAQQGTVDAVAALVRWRHLRTPARIAFDGKDHFSEWGEWEPCTLSYALAVTDPQRNTPALYEMRPLTTPQPSQQARRPMTGEQVDKKGGEQA